MNCSDCHLSKHPSMFPKEKRNRSGRKSRCKVCEQKRIRAIVTSTPLAGFRNQIQRARRRGKFQVAITARYLLELWEKQRGLCVLSGVKMVWRVGEVRLTSMSVDRIDHLKGYAPGNVRLICFGLNNLRSHRSDKEALELARAYVRHQS